MTARLIDGELVVEAADRIGRRLDLQGEIGERLHVRVGDLPLVTADQQIEGDVERLESEGCIECLRIADEGAAAAIAAPMHRAFLREPAQRLRGHRSLHRMKWTAETG